MSRRLAAEALGTAFLLAAVVGSGIMGERLSNGNDALALLANTLATGAALAVLILMFGPVSGAHFNPAVTLVLAARRETPWRDVPGYIAVQVIGALAGVAAAHAMFGEPLFTASAKARDGAALLFAEFVATFGLIGVIVMVARARTAHIPYAVAGYIMAAYWFTSSTSFANPAVTLARSFTDSFSGISPGDMPGFIAAECVGAAAGAAVFGWLARED